MSKLFMKDHRRIIRRRILKRSLLISLLFFISTVLFIEWIFVVIGSLVMFAISFALQARLAGLSTKSYAKKLPHFYGCYPYNDYDPLNPASPVYFARDTNVGINFRRYEGS